MVPKSLLNWIFVHFQVWDVDEAIDWMKKLAQFKPWFIEEPTAPGQAFIFLNCFCFN
jgi:hypothetical protein